MKFDLARTEKRKPARVFDKRVGAAREIGDFNPVEAGELDGELLVAESAIFLDRRRAS